MMRLSLRNLLAHKLRLLLSGAAVVLGVAFISGTMVFTDTLERTFTDLFDNTSADVNIAPAKAFDTGLAGTSIGGTRPSMPEAVLDRVEEVDGVAVAEGYVQAEGVYVLTPDGEVLDIGGAPGIGTSWSDQEALSNAALVEGRAPSSSREVVLDTGTVEKAGLEVGEPVTVLTTGPKVEAELVGVVQFGEEGGLAGASLTVFDMTTAQRLLLEPGRLSGVTAAAEDGVSHRELADRVAAALGPRYEVKTQEEQAQDLAAALQESLSFINAFLLVFAGVALFVGSFIILNTFSMLVAQRTRELALFRALGATRRQTTWSVLIEAFVLGVFGAATGLVLGYGLALALKAFFGRFGLTLDGSLVFAADTVAWSLAVGVFATMLAAYLPARRASRVPPIAAMNPDIGPAPRSLRVRVLFGAPLALLGAAALLLGPEVLDGSAAGAVAGAGAAAAVVGVIALSPVLARPFIAVVGWVLARVAGKTGQLAAENALRNPRRTAATSSALMIGLTLVTGFAIIGASTKASVDAMIVDTMQADYVVSTAVGQPFTSSIADELAAVDGVESVTRTRFGMARFSGEESMFVAYDVSTVDRALDVDFLSGSLDELRGNGLLIEDTVAEDRGWSLGDPVEVVVPTGDRRELTVRGTFERNNVLGTYLVSMETFTDLGGAPMDRYVYLNLSPDVDPSAIKADLDEVVSAYPVVDLKDAAAFQEEQRGQVDQMLMLINALLVLSVLIAVLGVVNTLVLSVIERTRELGLLRAIGMKRRQIRQLVRLESVMISVYGAVLGLGLGLFLGVGLTRALRGQGIEEIVIPGTQLAAFLFLGALIGVAAAVFPARRAARLQVLEAIATQ